MSFETIRIYRDFPIKNQYVQIPPNREWDKIKVDPFDALNAVPGAEIVRLSSGSGRNVGKGYGQQSFLRLPGLIPGTNYATDPVDDLNA